MRTKKWKTKKNIIKETPLGAVNVAPLKLIAFLLMVSNQILTIRLCVLDKKILFR